MAPTPSLTQGVGRVTLVVLVLLFVLFAAFNAHYVDFSWVFGGTAVVETSGQRTSGGVPLIAMLVLSFVVGAVVGRLSGWRSRRSRKRSAAGPPAGREEPL